MEIFDKKVLEESLKKWLESLENDELSDNTLKRYKINMTSFINFVDKKPIEKSTIIAYKDYLINDKNYLYTTGNNYIISLNKFLKYLGYENFKVKLLRIQRRDSVDDYISYTDYHRLLRCTKNRGKEKTWMILRVLAETGIRVGELKFFTVESLNTSIVVKFKNKERSIIVTRSLLLELKKYIRRNHITSGYIFPGKDTSKPFHDSSVRKLLKQAAGYSKIKLSKVHPHSFRHYFAVKWLEEHPNDLVTLADLMGHSRLETTRIYLRLNNNQKEMKLRNIKF